MSDVMVGFVAEGRVFAEPDRLNGKDRASFRAKTPLCFAALKLPSPITGGEMPITTAV